MVEFFYNVDCNWPAEECFYPNIFIKGEREHLKFEIAPSQFRDKFSAEEIGVGAGYENGVTTFFTKSIDDVFKSCHVLNFINEEIGCSGFGSVFVDELFESVWCFYGSVRSAIKIKIYNMRIGYAFCSKFVGNYGHQTRFTTTTHSSNDFYHVSVVVKTSYFLEVCFSFEVIHVQKYSKCWVKMQVKGVRFVKGNECAPLNIVFSDIDRWGMLPSTFAKATVDRM